jgi:hypothetical protein
MDQEPEKYMDDVIWEIAREIEGDSWKPDQDGENENAGRMVS